jgi:cytochrome c biogenesis protein CcmG/thiol:disulfide interchange protein DsbE
MKYKNLQCFLLMMLIGVFAWAAGPKEGSPAPRATATALSGAVLDTEALRGKVVMLHFWATWCPPCREEMPVLEKFYKEHHEEGFEIIAVSMDEAGDESKVKQFVQNYSYPVAMQSASKVEQFGRIWTLPLTFVIDRKGILRKSDWTGQEKIDAASLAKIMLPLLQEK